MADATQQDPREHVLDLIAFKDFNRLALFLAEAIESGCEDLRPLGELYTNEETEVHGFTLNLVHSVGGREGEGETVERVIEVKDGDAVLCYFQFTGFYASNEGTEWGDDAYQVYPREVLVTQYFDTP